MEYYRCTAKRPKSEDGEQRSSGARVSGRGGEEEGRGGDASAVDCLQNTGRDESWITS